MKQWPDDGEATGGAWGGRLVHPWSTSTHTAVSFSAAAARGGRGRKNDNGGGEVVDAGGPLVPGFNDCDQGCRFVILAARAAVVGILLGSHLHRLLCSTADTHDAP